jgi:ATP synthase protein I
MNDDQRPPTLEDLSTRLRQARKAREPRKDSQTPTGNLGRALHLAIEMMAGLAAGGGIGWYLDRLLGTKPWLMVVFLFIGLAAGVRNVMRSVARLNEEIERQEKESADRTKSDRAGDDRG